MRGRRGRERIRRQGGIHVLSGQTSVRLRVWSARLREKGRCHFSCRLRRLLITEIATMIMLGSYGST